MFASLCVYKLVSTDFTYFLAWWEALLVQSELDSKGLRLLTLFILTLLHIGKECNHYFFNKDPPDPMHVVSCVLFDFSQLQLSGIFIDPSSRPSHMLAIGTSLISHSLDFVLLYCDVSWKD